MMTRPDHPPEVTPALRDIAYDPSGAAREPHTGDYLTHAELLGMTPGVISFYCEAYHYVGLGQDWHCYVVHHTDGPDPQDPDDDFIYWIPWPGECPIVG
jgi:hypothetical protein